MQPNPVDVTAAVPSVVAETLATVSRHGGLAEGRTETALQGLARAAVEAVSSAQMASLTAFDASGRPFTPVFTSDEAGAMDQAQYLSAGGPSLEAATSPRWISVTVTDLMTESRWPHLTDDALGLGIRSVLSVSLFAEVSLDLDDDSPSVGALTLYSREPDAFGEPERIIALLLALFWAGLLRSSAAIDAADLQLDHLHQAMLSRNVIGQAQGILMERERLTSGQAFDRLRTASQHLNRKLRDVAAQVAETGVIPVIDGHREPQPTKSADVGEEYRLAAVRRYDILDTPPDGAFDRIAALAGRLLQVPIGMVNIVDSDRVWVKAAHGLPDRPELGAEPGLCVSVVTRDGPYLVTDAAVDPRTREHPLVTGHEQIRFYAAAPLITADGHRLGTLAVLDRQPHDQIADAQLAILEDLATLVVDQLELRLAALQLVRHKHRA